MQSRLPRSDKILRHFQIISGFIWSSLTGYPRPCFRYSLSHIRLGIISITNNKWSLLINTLLFDCYFFVFCGGFFCVWKLTTIKQSTGNGSLLKNYWILKIIFLSNVWELNPKNPLEDQRHIESLEKLGSNVVEIYINLSFSQLQIHWTEIIKREEPSFINRGRNFVKSTIRIPTIKRHKKVFKEKIPNVVKWAVKMKK